MTTLTQSLAQALDMHVNGSLLNRNLIAPNSIQQVGARMHTSHVLHKVGQQFELGRSQFERDARMDRLMRTDIEAEWANL